MAIHIRAMHSLWCCGHIARNFVCFAKTSDLLHAVRRRRCADLPNDRGSSKENSMSRLPTSLVIALWFTGAVWLVAFLVYVFGVDRHVLYATSLFGLVIAVLEWRASRKS